LFIISSSNLLIKIIIIINFFFFLFFFFFMLFSQFFPYKFKFIYSNEMKLNLIHIHKFYFPKMF